MWEDLFSQGWAMLMIEILCPPTKNSHVSLVNAVRISQLLCAPTYLSNKVKQAPTVSSAPIFLSFQISITC